MLEAGIFLTINVRDNPSQYRPPKRFIKCQVEDYERDVCEAIG